MEEKLAGVDNAKGALAVGGSHEELSGYIPTNTTLAPELGEFLDVVTRVVARAIANQRQAGLQYPVTDEATGGVKCGQ